MKSYGAGGTNVAAGQGRTNSNKKRTKGDEDELALFRQRSPNAITKITTVTVDSSAHPQAEISWWSPTSPRMRV